MKCYTEITGWGKDSLFFLEDPDALFLILFNDDAPEELAEISVLHRKSCVLQRITAGDTLIIAEKAFDITAIGEEVQHTLQQLGHCTLCFKGGDVPDRPGCIMLQGDEPLRQEDLHEGQSIEIH